MADKRAYHPNGSAYIDFSEKEHTYTDNMGVLFLSGTSFISRFFPKFDSDSMSKRCAAGRNPKYAGREPGAILAEWNAEAERGSSEGDNTHLYAEGMIAEWDKSKLPAPISDRCVELFAQVDLAVAGLLKKFVFIAAEMVIFSPGLGLSGMIDLVMYCEKTNNIILLDWKQNKEIKTKGFRGETANKPIDHLQASDISKYTLQLSTYQYILDREWYFPGVSGYRRALIHITPDSFRPISLEYYDYEMELMIEEVKHT